MSVASTSRTQRRDKPSNATHKGAHASAEEIRLAQIIGNTGQDEDIEIQKNVAKVIEVTGTTEDNARTALYDSNNDTSRAIELILENNSLEQTNEWETACRRKNKQNQNVSRGVDTFDDEISQTLPQNETFEKSSSKGRGRGRNLKGRGKSNDPDRPNDRGVKDGSESRDRSQKDRRGRGRGFGRGNRRGGGPPRRYGRYNQNKGDGYSKDQSSDDKNDFGGKFGTFTTSTTANHTSDAWEADEDWGNLEVGTWSNDDAHKQSEKKSDPANEAWGTGSWNDDLLESQVFQSQNAQQIPSTMPPSQPNHVAGSNGPQMGERIDLGTLFKKSNNEPAANSYPQPMSNDSLINQTGMVFNNSGSGQHPTPSVIQQLQQQGQSSSLFSDTKIVNDMDSKSRLFGAYERPVNNTTTPSTATDGGPFTTESSYSQYNDKLMSDNNESSASLLGTFGEQFKPSSESSMRLGQMPELTKSPYTPLSQTDSQNSVTAPTGFRNFSEVQQREATEAVKASLGLPSATNESIPPVAPTGSSSLNQSENMVPQNTLSFGAPQSTRMKQQRRKMPTISSKIPSSAVEMPGAGGGSFHELTNLQFGIDDAVATVTTQDFSTVNGTIMDSSLASTQTSLYNSNVITSPASLINHMTTGNLEDASIFSSQLSNQKPQTINHVEASMKATEANSSTPSQRYPEPLKSTDTTLRGPPGITHPQSISTSASPPSGNLGVLSSSDLSSSGGSYGTGRMVASANIPLSGIPLETTNEAPQNLSNQIHSYYTSSSLSQQSQHMATDHSNSAGRSLRSPAPTSQKSHSGTPSKDANSAAATSISSLTGSLAQTHMTSHVGGTPTKIQTTTASAPINILGASDSNTSLGAGGAAYGSINLGYNTSSAPSASSQSSTPAAASPGKHMSETDLYTTTGLSSIHHNHQPASTSSISSNALSSVLSLQTTSAAKSSMTSSGSKTGPPNLPLGVPPLLPNQYGIPMAPGLMPAYTPEALYGYPDPLVAVQSRVHQVPNYYDVYGNTNPTNSSTVNREPSTTTTGQGKFGRGEPSSPTSLIGVVNSAGANLAQQQQLASGQHSTQIKVSQSGAHQAQPFVNLPTATPAAFAAGYGGGLYYNFQYPPTMFAAATAVPSAKHQGNTTAAFQQPATAFANAYSTSSINASSASNLHELQGQGYNKNHVPGYDKQTFHHHTNTPPPFNIQSLTAAMAAAGSGAAAGGAPAMNPYTQAPFMTVLPTHQHSQIHLHLPHGDAAANVGSQRSQDSNPMGKAANKGLFGSNPQYGWGN